MGRMAVMGSDTHERVCARCGHSAAAHRHYRVGSDCALCECVRFRGRFRVVDLVGRLLGRGERER